MFPKVICYPALVNIFIHLDPDTLLAAAMVCRYVYIIVFQAENHNAGGVQPQTEQCCGGAEGCENEKPSRPK